MVMEWSNGKFSIKGDAEELSKFFNDKQIEPHELLSQGITKYSMKSFVCAAILYIIVVSIVLYLNLNGIWMNCQEYKVIIMLVSFAVLLLACNGHYKEKVPLGIVTIIGLVIMLVSMLVYTPEEALKEVKDKAEIILKQ